MILCLGGGIGIRDRLKIYWPQGLEGSSPSLGTLKNTGNTRVLN